MSAADPALLDTAEGVAVVDTPEQLSLLHRPDKAAVIWQRQPLASFQRWIDALDPDQLPSARLILRPRDVRSALKTICDTSETPDGPERRLLIDDIAALADIFTDLMQAEYLRLRLDVVDTNACRKFHVDMLTARLICTYRGTGTQYGNAVDEADPQQVFTVPGGSPIILRGKKWPEQPRSGLLHRSPPVEGTGETRLLMVLDPISDPSLAH